jgi:hypothetical protein
MGGRVEVLNGSLHCVVELLLNGLTSLWCRCPRCWCMNNGTGATRCSGRLLQLLHDKRADESQNQQQAHGAN